MRRYLPFVFLLAACGLDASSEPASLPAKLRAVSERMHARFAATERIEQGIVTSRIQDVHAAAHVIASLEDPEVLPEWQPYLASVKLAAREIESADNVIDAARLTGELGRQCARCHVAISANIQFRGKPRPDTGKRLQDTMAGHQWAVARMWEGLVGPNEDRWTTGAKVLQKAPLTFVAESGELGIADNVVLVRLLARRAEATPSQTDRAVLYGRLLGTCATCHATIRDRPGDKTGDKK
jgi:hypothetical protein